MAMPPRPPSAQQQLSRTSSSSTVYWDALEAGEPLPPDRYPLQSCRSRCCVALALLWTPLATTVALGAWSCCLALSTSSLADGASLPVHPLTVLLLGCSASSLLPARARKVGALLGCCLPAARYYFLRQGVSEPPAAAYTWAGAGLALGPLALQVCSVRGSVGGDSLCLGVALFAVVGGGAVGQRLRTLAPPSAGPALAVLQVVGLLLTSSPGSATSNARPGLCTDALRLASHAARTTWFWSLLAIASGLGHLVRHLGIHLQSLLPSGASLLWALGVLGFLVARVLCGRQPQLHSSPNSCKWVAGYAAVRAVGSRGASPEGIMAPLQGEDNGTGRLEDDKQPDTSGGKHCPEGLVREVQQLSTLLLHPMAPLSALSGQDPAFINQVLASLWPVVRGFVEEDILKGEVERILQRDLSGALGFDHVSLGDAPVHVHAAWVVPPSLGANTITLALDVEFDGRDMDVALKFGLGLLQLSVGITKLSIRGRLFVAFRHLTPHLPLTQGVNVFFANPPSVDLELSSPSGAVSLLPGGVKAGIAAAFSNGITQTLVLPYRVAVPFSDMWPYTRLQHSRPEGILCCRVVGACCALPPRGLGSFALTKVLSCRLQLGAYSWHSAAVQSRDGDFVWDESPTLVVDDKANQELIVTLHEQQTLSSAQVTEQHGIGTRELVEQSCRHHVPVWHLPSAQGACQLMLSATWHPLSHQRAALTPHLGSLFVVTIDCARHAPAKFEGKSLEVRILLLEKGDEPEQSSKPVAQTCRMQASAVTPTELGCARLLRLQRMNFPRNLPCGVNDSDSEREADAGCSSLSPADVQRWRERLEHMWQHFQTVDNRHLSDWVREDRDTCIHTLAGLFGVGVWDEPLFGEVVDEICERRASEGGQSPATSAHSAVCPPAGGRSGGQPRDAPPQPPPGRAVECHWWEQLRIPAASPRTQEAVIQIVHIANRKDPEVLGSWRKPLQDLLAAPRMTDPMCGRAMVQLPAGHGDIAQPLMLYVQLELLHVLPAETMQSHSFQTWPPSPAPEAKGSTQPTQTQANPMTPTPESSGQIEMCKSHKYSKQ